MKIKNIFGKILGLFEVKKADNIYLEEINNARSEQPMSEPGASLYEGLRHKSAFEALNRLDNGSEFYRDLRDKLLKAEEEDRKNSKFLELNLKGKELERAGRIEEAIRLYEENVANGFDGSFPYNRLAIIYRKRKDYDNEIRILQKAINVFEDASDYRSDKAPKLGIFSERMQKAQILKSKHSH